MGGWFSNLLGNLTNPFSSNTLETGLLGPGSAFSSPNGSSSSGSDATSQQSAALQAYYNSDPAFAAEYARVQAQGDKRSPQQWISDFISSTPGQSAKFQQFSSTGVNPDHPTSATAASVNLSAYPDLLAAYNTAKAANPNLTEGDFIVQWANANPTDSRLNDPTFLGNVGLEQDPSSQEPLEQGLLQTILDKYVTPDMNADAGRQAQAQQILDSYNTDINSAENLASQATDGTRLQGEYNMSGTTAQGLRDAADAQASGQGTALDTLTQQRLAALDPLNAARTSAAETQVSGINQELGQQKDQITAQDALSGFLGGSSMRDSALARAAYGARQTSAQAVGSANVANATDTRTINDDTAQARAQAEFNRLAGVNTADQDQANWNKTYYDNDFQRALQDSLIAPTLETNRLQMMGALDNYGQSGLGRSLNTLNWFGTSPTNPDYSIFQTQASNAGSQLASLGSGLIGTGLNIAKTNNWFSTPATSSTIPQED